MSLQNKVAKMNVGQGQQIRRGGSRRYAPVPVPRQHDLPPPYQSSDSEDDGNQAAGVDPNAKRVRMFDVKMPTGLLVAVTIPARKCNCKGDCTFALRLTELTREGAMGSREFSIVAGEMSNTIRKHSMQAGGKFSDYDIITIHKIQNCCLWRKFRAQEAKISRDSKCCNERMLFHGSNAADQIAQYGFNKNCAKPNGMFGQAIYFAQHSSKSNQYVYGYLNGKGCPAHKDKSCYRCERKLLLCRVVLGKTNTQTSVNKMASSPQGYNSVRGAPSSGGLRYPEFAIYNPAQAYPEYLITYRIAK